MSKAKNSSPECKKDFKIPNYIWNLKLFVLIPRDNGIPCQSMFCKLFKPLAECWARPRILPQVPDSIPPKIRFFMRSRSCILRFRHVMLSALTDGPRHCYWQWIATVPLRPWPVWRMTSHSKNLGHYHSFQWLPKVPEFSTSLQNDKLFSFLCRWERWVVEVSLLLWYSTL